MIRPAVVDDLPAILDLIHELAAYEREPDAVLTTTEDLRRALFGDQPTVFAHVAEQDGAVVGAAIWYVSFSTWTGRSGIYLQDLVIRQDARGGGHGRALMRELARICLARGYRRLDWSVLDWNVDAQRFYTGLGAVQLPDWQSWRLAGPGLEQLGG